MSDAFLGEIRMFVGNYAPIKWTKADGQLLQITDNAALYSLWGTNYGGNGINSFGIPDLRGRIPLHQGQGPGLSYRQLGQKAGQEFVTLSASQIPAHSHAFQASANTATTTRPEGTVVANVGTGNQFYKKPNPPVRDLDSAAVMNAGADKSHFNMMAYQCLTFILCLNGIYPPRN